VVKEGFIAPAPLQTAVLFLVFNRPNTTKQVFESIRQAKPPRLYVAADGPRAGKDGEFERVEEVRQIVAATDWPCEVKTLFRENNLGCKYAVSSAISWFFQNEEQGIILEDDCLPSQSFFWFCEELLKKYKDDQSIYLISGDARGSEAIGMSEDYGLCKYSLIWGWASWARVWKDYDVEIKSWPNNKGKILSEFSHNSSALEYWNSIFNDVWLGKVDTWDYQLMYQLFRNKSKCIVPRVNLVSNIGFGIEATHTLIYDPRSANRARLDINLPLKHLVSQSSEIKVNNYFESKIFTKKTISIRFINRIARLIFGKSIF